MCILQEPTKKKIDLSTYTPPPEIEEKISKAKARLILTQPFFGFAVCQREITINPNIPTADCSARGKMRVNPDFIRDRDISEVVFLLAHEAMHYMLHHVVRIKGRQPQKWNIACDMVINETLIESKVGTFIDGGARYPNAQNLSADEVYNLLPDMSSEGGNGGSGNGGSGNGDGENGGIGNDLSDEDGPLDEAEAAAIEARAQTELLQAAKVAKMAGKLPANIARLVEEIVNVKTPWHEILERFFNGFVQDEYSWQRPNRRTAHMDVYLPSRGYVPKMGEVVIGVDTSGSIGGPELAEFQGHVNRIMEQCRPAKVTVLYCDAHVGSTEEFTVEELPIQFTKVTGGGGTSFEPVFRYVNRMVEAPDVVVYLTDGYGDQNSIKAPAYPVVWLTTGSTEFPFGEVVKFEK